MECVLTDRLAQRVCRLGLLRGQVRPRQVRVHRRERRVGRHVDRPQGARLGQSPHNTGRHACRLRDLRSRHGIVRGGHHVQHLGARVGHARGCLAGGGEHGLGRRRQQAGPRPQRHGQQMSRMAHRVTCGKGQEIPHRLGHRRRGVHFRHGFQRAALRHLIAQQFNNDSQPLMLSQRRSDIAAFGHIQIVRHRIVKRLRQGHGKENPGDGHKPRLSPSACLRHPAASGSGQAA